MAGRKPLRFGRQIWLWLVAGLVAGLGVTSPTLAAGPEASRAFRRAIEAADDEIWAEVVEGMHEALAIEATQGGRVKIYGMRFEPYIPHYWLGVARQELGDCRAAMPSLEAARPFGELLAPTQRRDLERRLESCANLVATSQGPATSPRNPEAMATTVPVREAATPQEAPKQAPPFLRRAAASYLSGQYEQVTSALDGLRGLSEDPAAIATGLLLRSAAGFALYRRQISPDAARLDAAREDLKAYLQLQPDQRPSAFWFSPAFLALYDESRTPR